jgi:hypothetical protein
MRLKTERYGTEGSLSMRISGAIMKNKAFILIMLFICIPVISTCSPPANKKTNVYPLTTSLIKRYHLTPQDLSQLQYYLEKDLHLIGSYNLTVRAINKNLGLEVYRQNDKEIVYFKAGLAGIATDVGKEPLVKFFNRSFFYGPLKITVCFNRFTDACLTFRPNKAGRYIIESKDGRTVKFAGGKYVLDKEWDQNGLLVEITDAQVREKIQSYEIESRKLRRE